MSKENYYNYIKAILGVTLYALLQWALFGFLDNRYDCQSKVSLSFMCVMPFCASLAVTHFLSRRLKPRLLFVVHTLFLWIGFSLLAGLAKPLGLAVAMPVTVVFLLAGALAGLAFRYEHPHILIIAAAIILPASLGYFETREPTEPAEYRVETTILADAPLPVVWVQTTSILNIHHDELVTTVTHSLGMPKPIEANLDKQGLGGVRFIRWEQGVAFREEISAWNEKQSFDYNVRFSPSSVPQGVMDNEITVGGQQFDVERGGYRFEPLNGGTRITLYSVYLLNTHFNFYAKLWADQMLDDVHHQALAIIKRRSENYRG